MANSEMGTRRLIIVVIMKANAKPFLGRIVSSGGFRQTAADISLSCCACAISSSRAGRKEKGCSAEQKGLEWVWRFGYETCANGKLAVCWGRLCYWHNLKNAKAFFMSDNDDDAV